MLPAAVSGDPAKRTAADNQTVRNVFVIGPDKKIKLILVYPMTTGRNFDEVLRVIDSLQLTAKHKVATPVNWKHGEDVIIAGSVTDEDAKKQYPAGLEVAEALYPHRAAAQGVSRRAESSGSRIYARGEDFARSHARLLSDRSSAAANRPILLAVFDQARVVFGPFVDAAAHGTHWSERSPSGAARYSTFRCRWTPHDRC